MYSLFGGDGGGGTFGLVFLFKDSHLNFPFQIYIHEMKQFFHL